VTKIDYELMVQESLRNVIKDTLKMVSKNGLPGTHHFYLSFKTNYPGVDLPDFLREEYPEEITIVLQYEFWDLEVAEESFCVTLCFNDIHERLNVPFNAIVSFVDPSVKFGLQFTPAEIDEDAIKTLPIEEKKKPTRKSTKSALETKNDTTMSDNVVTLDAFRKK
jgi:hypothetical protein